MDNQQESIFLQYPKDNQYIIDSNGNIFSAKREEVRALKPHYHTARGRKPYLRVKIAGKLELVHRVVASAKVGRSLTSSEQVNHLNGNTLDNRPENLDVVSFEENVKHAVENKLYCSGVDWHNARR